MDIINAKNLCIWYGSNKALKEISLSIPEKSITAFIGPSGCGKSTFLKTLNRMNDLVPGIKIEGKVEYEGKDMMADLYVCAMSEFAGNFTNDMKKMYETVKRSCYEEKITDEQIQGIARNKMTTGQSYLPVIHQEKTKGIFGNTKNQIEFYKIENQILENQIILERGKSQFGTFEYIGKNAGIIIPTNIKNTKNA